MPIETPDELNASWKRLEAERHARNAVERRTLFKELRTAGVALVTINYDGSGDSGDIQSTTFSDTKGKEMKDPGNFAERCNDSALEALEEKHGGWEINEGSYGQLIFDIKAGKVRFEHNERIESSEYHEAEDEVDDGGAADLRTEGERKAIEIADQMANSNKKKERQAQMSHPWHHAKSSARKYGGKPQDYLAIHNWFDETKQLLADYRHRALRHHAEGIFMAEKLFGIVLTNSDGKEVPVRVIGEQHVKE